MQERVGNISSLRELLVAEEKVAELKKRGGAFAIVGPYSKAGSGYRTFTQRRVFASGWFFDPARF